MSEHMELPRFEDFDTAEEYEQAMNMWAHDRLYGQQDDDMARLEWAGEEEDGYDEDLDEERYPCGCGFCNCVNDTVAGEVCNMCLRGEHQG